MKKLFALLSTCVLTLVIVGLAVKAPVAEAAADDKWTVDPTLAEDEIPMYEMGSIYTTFPNFYDNAKKPDPLWAGSSRMYPWNETRLRVAQYDATGAATGKYYAIYFSGLTSNVDGSGNPASGAGNNINGYAFKRNANEDGTEGDYVLVDGNKVLTTVRVKANTFGTEKVKFNYGTTPMDPSLSHLRFNFTGEDISVDGVALANSIGDGGNAHNFYNRMLVMDGQGRIIRGCALDGFYLKAGAEGAPEDVWAPQFCYVDGKVTYYVEGETVCDKVKEQAKDEEGNPIFESDGVTPVMVETNEDNFLYKRFVWEWFQEKPTNVNTASWKAEGWDCDLWDYVMDAPEGEGYIAIAFINSEGTNHKINDEERTITNATRKAAGQAEITAAEHLRECVREMRIPAGGATFDFGYLDKGVVSEAAKFNNIVRGAFLSGRTVKTVEYKTYNFSTTGLKIQEKVIDGKSYQLKDRAANYVEVMKGVKFNPAAILNYQGLASGFQEEGNVLSYAKDLDKLEYSMYVSKNNMSSDGDMVVYKYPYADKAEMIADFEKDVKAFFAPGTAAGGEAGKHQDFTVAGTTGVGWDFISTSYNAKCFWADASNRAKWVWMINYVSGVRKASGLATAAWDTIDSGFTSSPGTFNAEVQAFLTDTQLNPGAWNRTSDYSIAENATGFLPKETNQKAFLNYQIDTTDDSIGTIYSVKFIVNNPTVKDTMVIHYVVEDGYTPIINVQTAKLFINPTVVDGKVTIAAIDPMTFVKAYDGAYNGKTILGNDITHRVVFRSETLDFKKPVEGVHRVVATVANDVKHTTEVSFDVTIQDVTAPYVDFVDSLILQYGAKWSPELVVKKAVDNVDGDLMASTLDWCVDESSGTKVNTTKAGDYTVTVSVWDGAGNSVKSKKIKVTVLPQGLTKEDLKKELEDVNAKLVDISTYVMSIDGTVSELPNIEAIKTAVSEAIASSNNGNNNGGETTSCGSSATVQVVQFLAAGCLLAFLLRKKH